MAQVLVQRWVSYDLVMLSFEGYLRHWIPNKTEAPGVEWITMSNLKATKKLDTCDTVGLVQSWEQTCLEKCNKVSCQDLQDLAVHHSVLSGKWLFFVNSSEVDAKWVVIARAVFDGLLGNDAKVSTNHDQKGGKKHKARVLDDHKCDTQGTKHKKHPGLKPEKWIDDVEKPKAGTHVICVYTSSFKDLTEVFAIRDQLRQMGFVKKITYKPDAYSHCGVYTGNRWRIDPVIFYA